MRPEEIRRRAPAYKPTSRVYVVDEVTAMAREAGLRRGSILSWRQVQQTVIGIETGQKTSLERRAHVRRMERVPHEGGALFRKAARGWKEHYKSKQSLTEIARNERFRNAWSEWNQDRRPETGQKFGWFRKGARGRWFYTG